MQDVKRYKVEADGQQLVATVKPPLVVTGVETQSAPSPYVAPEQIDIGDGNVAVSNMGLDAAAGDAKCVQHFCADCCLPFRENRMIKFRGLWYGIPCGDYQHAVDILRKEKQRAFRPPRAKEPGDVPFVISSDF